jgi:hypothetical protein
MERKMVYSKARLYTGEYKVNQQSGFPDVAIEIHNWLELIDLLNSKDAEEIIWLAVW